MSDTPETMERETGSETMDCPNCGKSLAIETREDGSTTPVTCTKCYAEASKKEVASAQKELDALPRETGTSVSTTTEVKA